MKISYSALQLFKACPYLYWYRYVAGNRLPPSKEAKFGTLIHKVLEFIHQNPLKPATLNEALKELDALWQQNMSDNIFEGKTEEGVYFANAQNIIKEYLKSQDFQKTKLVALEKYFQVPFLDLKTNQTHFITGRIDRIDKHPDGSFEVIDYKTSARLPNQTTMANNLQLPLYHLALVELWPGLFQKQKRPIKLTLHYLRHNEKIRFQKSPAELKRLKQTVLKTIRQIQRALKNNHFPARLSPICEFYPNSTVCPFVKHKYQTQDHSPTPSENELQKILDQFLKLKKEQKHAKEQLENLKYQLHAYMDKNNLQGLYSSAWKQMVQRSDIPRYEYEREKVKKVLEPLGLWEKALTISNSALRSILNDLSKNQQAQIKKARYQTGTVRTLRIRKTK